MKKQTGKIVATARAYTVLHLYEHEKGDLRRKVNLAVLGKETVNKVDKKTGELVSDTPKEQEALVYEAHCNIAASHGITVEWDVTDQGEFINYRVVQGK